MTLPLYRTMALAVLITAGLAGPTMAQETTNVAAPPAAVDVALPDEDYIEVESSQIKAVKYEDAYHGTLNVLFRDGQLVSHYGVPRNVYDDFIKQRGTMGGYYRGRIANDYTTVEPETSDGKKAKKTKARQHTLSAMPEEGVPSPVGGTTATKETEAAADSDAIPAAPPSEPASPATPPPAETAVQPTAPEAQPVEPAPVAPPEVIPEAPAAPDAPVSEPAAVAEPSAPATEDSSQIPVLPSDINAAAAPGEPVAPAEPTTPAEPAMSAEPTSTDEPAVSAEPAPSAEPVLPEESPLTTESPPPELYNETAPPTDEQDGAYLEEPFAEGAESPISAGPESTEQLLNEPPAAGEQEATTIEEEPVMEEPVMEEPEAVSPATSESAAPVPVRPEPKLRARLPIPDVAPAPAEETEIPISEEAPSEADMPAGR